MTEREGSVVKLTVFSGKAQDYADWWRCFKTFAAVHKFTEALQVQTSMPATAATALSLVDTERVQQLAAIRKNDIAMSQFNLALLSDQDKGLIYKSGTTGWPDGLACRLVTLLDAKYNARDLAALLSLKQELNNITMKDDEEPAAMFGRLARIKMRYDAPGDTMPDTDIMTAALRAAPAQYQPVLTAIRIAAGQTLTSDMLEVAMTSHWKLVVASDVGKLSSKKKDRDTNGEVQLAAVGTRKNKNACWDCGNPGHKQGNAECPAKGKGLNKPNRNRGNNNKGKACATCGKSHKGPCWEDPRNAHLRPVNWKSGKTGEVSAASVNGGENEFLLCSLCLEQPATEDLKSLADKTTEYVLAGLTFPSHVDLLKDPNIFIADTGSSCHSTKYDMGFSDVRVADSNYTVTMANGAKEKSTKVGNIRGIICDKEGMEVSQATMVDVTYLPGGHFNLFSCSRLTQEGWTMHGDKSCIKMTKGKASICFDIVIPTAKGAIYAMYFKREMKKAVDVNDVSSTAIAQEQAPEQRSKTMTIMQAHNRLGHAHEDAIRKAAKVIGFKITQGKMGPCEGCTLAKAKQKNVPKLNTSHVKSTVFPECIFIDITTLKLSEDEPKLTKSNMLIVVDEATQLKLVYFYDHKDQMVEPLCQLISKWRQNNKIVARVRMDNAGENMAFLKRSEHADWKLNLKFEITARDTPQQNHLAELGIAILMNKSRAMMASANIPLEVKYKVAKEAIKTAALLDGLLTIDINGTVMSRYEHAFGKNPKCVNFLRTFGEAGTVKTRERGTPKLANRGVACMFIGYPPNHEGDVYRMWNPVTNGVHTTRDVIWLRRMYYNKEMGQNIIINPNILPDIEDDDGVTVPPWEGEDDDDATVIVTNPAPEVQLDEVDRPAVMTRSGRVTNQPKRLIQEIGAMSAQGFLQAANYEIKLTNAELNYYQVMTQLNGEIGCYAMDEYALVGAALGGGFENTNELHVLKYKEAITGPDKKQWKRAIKEEHERMVKMGVWKAVPPENVPPGTKPITSTWACKKKSNGTYRARVNARGYEQIPGEHYDPKSIAAPVTNDITIRVILILMIMAMWCGELLDVKGAFLHGLFGPKENPLYMHIPQGFTEYYPPGWILLLLKTIYGLKQAAYAFWKQLLKAFSAMNFMRSKADPCLYYAWTKHGLVTWISWVDDCLVCGSKEGVKIAKAQLMEQFDCDEVGNMDEYVGCKIDRDWDDGSLRFIQPVLIQSFKDKFELPVSCPPNTPAAPGDHLVKGDEGSNMGPDLQFKYRSGVGKLMHMLRWSRPEILNAVHDLSKYMSGATLAHMKALIRVMHYCHKTPERGLLLKPTRKWNGDPKFEFIITGYSDSDYAKDTDTRRSVSGTAVFLEDAPVSMRSNTQKSVTLSVTEAEQAAAVACAQDMLFVMRLVESIGLKVKKPMILKLDNKGAHDLAHNWTIGGRTRHVDVRMNFLRELKEDGVILTEWIAGESNPSDLFTKNLQGPDFDKHSTKFVGSDDYMKVNMRNK